MPGGRQPVMLQAPPSVTSSMASIRSLLLGSVLFCMLSKSCAASIHDSTLPVVNVKYDFAAQDTPLAAKDDAGTFHTITF